MGVASGKFDPTDAFAQFRSVLRPALDGARKEQRDMRYLAGLRAITANGVALVCSHVEVIEYGEIDEPFALEVFCNGIPYPLYEELFPDHVKAYEGQFQK